MNKLSFLLLAIFISQNTKADPVFELDQLIRQIDVVSQNIQNADKYTNVRVELDSLIALQRDYEEKSCDYLKDIRNNLAVAPSEIFATLKQVAKKRLCGSNNLDPYILRTHLHG